jgi:hypothetical protein
MSRTRRILTAALALPLALGLSAPRQALAQDVEYTTVSKFEMGGVVGSVVRLFTGNTETVQKTYIKGTLVRTDAGTESSSITDLENGRFMTIDHKAKTYTVVTLDQMLGAMQEMQGRMQQAQAEAQPARQAPPDGQVDLKFDLKVDRTGEKQRVAGYEAERVLMTMTTTATVTPEGGQAEQAGRLVMLVDSWNAKDVPAARAMAAVAEVAPALMEQQAAGMQNIAAALMSDPQLQEALEQAAAEAAKIDGFTMKSTTHLVIVPQDREFDRALALAEGGGQQGSGGRGGIGGLLRGAAGLGRGQQQQQQPAEVTQVTLAKVIEETREMKTGNLAASLFEPPAGYREVEFRMPVR